MSRLTHVPRAPDPVYFCPRCKTAYNLKYEAVSCSRRPFTCAVAVGDLVSINGMEGTAWAVTAVGTRAELVGVAPFPTTSPAELHEPAVRLKSLMDGHQRVEHPDDVRVMVLPSRP